METAVLKDWLTLHFTPGIGPALFTTILQHFDPLSSFFQTPVSILGQLGLPKKTLSALQHPDAKRIESALAWAQEPQNTILTLADPHYPLRLKQIADPPPILYVQGDCTALSTPLMGVVGTRRPTAGGRRQTAVFAQGLIKAGFGICSGLALGVDGCAHQTAVDERGITVAVVATGLDKVYPHRHRPLAQRILERGAILSEFPLGTPPKATHFPRRNRLISGLSLGVLVVEAALRSGSLITARYALEQNREVFAIPSSIQNDMAKGCHQLIRAGAKLVEGIDDMLEEYPQHQPAKLVAEKPPNNEPLVLDKKYDTILGALGYDRTPIEFIIQTTGLPAATVQSQLLELELSGVVQREPGGYLKI